MEDPHSTLTLVSQPQDFFRELITQALIHQKIHIKPETEFYLVNLLNQFMITEHLYTATSEGNRSESLVELIQQALEQPALKAQAALFRHIGDVSLYTAGFFQESLNRKLLDIHFYMNMGALAYHQVFIRIDEETLKKTYLELSEKFSSFVEILAEVSDITTHRTEKDLLRTYEIWVQTRSKRAAKTLEKAGILPNETIKKKWQ